MDSSSIELPGSEIASIELSAGVLRIRFARAYLIKTLTGSVERTRWWQTGDLVLEGVDSASAIPSGAVVCAGGDLDDNVFTYRDMIPVPLDSRGRTGCRLRFQGLDAVLEVSARTLRLELAEVAKYIEHIRPGEG